MMSGTIEKLKGISLGRKTMLVITVSVVVILLVMTFVVPDRTGQVRTDLVVGDYYIMDSSRFYITYLVEGIDGDTLTVSIDSVDKNDHTERLQEAVMSKDEYLSNIKFSEEIKDQSEIIGAVFYDTFAGHKFCRIYYNVMNAYHVGEYGVIYCCGIGGNFWMLHATSLLYGVDYSEEPPKPNIKIHEVIVVD